MSGRRHSDGARDIEGERYGDGANAVAGTSSGRGRVPPWSKLVVQGVPVRYPALAVGEELWREKGKEYGLSKEEVLKAYKHEVLRSARGGAEEVEDVVVTLPTFLQRFLAEDGFVQVAGARRRCRRFFQVMQCRRCCRYGHGYRECVGRQVCKHCGGGHQVVDCGERTRRCVLCVENGELRVEHSAGAKECPARKAQWDRAERE